jgi:hypothetical protein
MRDTNSRLAPHAPGARVRTLARKGIGFALFLGGSTVIVVYLLRCFMDS